MFIGVRNFKEGSGTIFLSPKFFPIKVMVGEKAQTLPSVDKSSNVPFYFFVILSIFRGEGQNKINMVLTLFLWEFYVFGIDSAVLFN